MSKHLIYMEAQNMSTTMVTKETVTRKWYVLDAAGKPMGRTAATRRRPSPRQAQDRLTPRTLTAAITSSSSTPRRLSSPARSSSRSTTVHHSGWIRRPEGDQVQAPSWPRRPEFAMRAGRQGHAPEEHHRLSAALTRLRALQAGAEHTHAAQKPEVWDSD